MRYKIKFVSDDVMPDSHEWAICHVEGKVVLYLRESSRGKSSREAAAILEGAWEGYRTLTQGGPAAP